MTPENFCYWLQGFMEIGNPEILNGQQLEQIKNHLQLVFKKETPIIHKRLCHVNTPNKNGDVFPNFSDIIKYTCESSC